MPATHYPWEQLPSKTQENVLLVATALDEFREGFHLYFTIIANARLGAPLVRFLYSAVNVYLVGYYLDSRIGVLPVLSAIGRGDVADEIEGILATRAGDKSVREHLNDYRNRFPAHPLFTISGYEEGMSMIGSVDHDVAAKSEALLGRRTIEILHLLEDAYPEQVKGVLKSSRGQHVGKPPSA